jgi:hypothetical protein
MYIKCSHRLLPVPSLLRSSTLFLGTLCIFSIQCNYLIINERILFCNFYIFELYLWKIFWTTLGPIIYQNGTLTKNATPSEQFQNIIRTS